MDTKLIKRCISEILGTFIFLGVIITVVNDTTSTLPSLKIGLALMIAIVFFGDVSGGHFNPAVSIMFFMNEKLDGTDLIFYILSQIIGAMLAYFVFMTIINKENYGLNLNK